jgi:fumarate reductase subunit C
MRTPAAYTEHHPPYTEYHPRWLRQHVSTYWWLHQWSYAAFILREASCVPVAWFVVFLLMLVSAVGDGDAAYRAFLAWSSTGPIVAVNVVSFGFIIFHAITFFQAAPQALVVHLGRKRVPASLIGWGHYGALVVASIAVWWLLIA